jgi:hypothetical protein
LFNVNDSFASDYPNIKIVVNPNGEKQKPEKSEEKTAHKGSEIKQKLFAKFIKEKSSEEITAKKKKYHKENYEKVGEYIEPVAVDYHKNFLAVFLSFEMIVGEGWLHKINIEKLVLKLARSNQPKKIT